MPAQVERVRGAARLREADEFLSVHGPAGGKPASECDGTWALYQGRTLVGVACSNWVKTRHYHLSNAAVHEEHRGKGLQVALIQARLRHARILGREVQTYTHESNVPSMINLLKAGLHPAGSWHQWVLFTNRSGEP